RVKQLHESLPKTRWNASLSRGLGPFSVLGRVSYYGGWFDDDDNQNYTGKHLFDFELSYLLRQGLKLSVGAQNAFNTYTDRSRLGSAGPGNLYSQFSPFGFDGGYYYLRLNYSWGARF
ncbi:MAG: TonB-dependent receptor, partial [Bryobacterales bacterium]|nr:TonB-dependent receptor [Bryobacterales bacterium]